MRYVYPVKLTLDTDGRYVSTSRDVPEAITDGDSERSALEQMSAALGAALAQRLGISEGAVRRLVNPDHASRLDGVVAALSCLGRRLVIEDLVAA